MIRVLLIGPKVTFLVALLTGLTCSALLVFKMDVGVFVDMDDREETDDPAVVMVPNEAGFKQKPGLCARL